VESTLKRWDSGASLGLKGVDDRPRLSVLSRLRLQTWRNLDRETQALGVLWGDREAVYIRRLHFVLHALEVSLGHENDDLLAVKTIG
jgi:hypothetical protein